MFQLSEPTAQFPHRADYRWPDDAPPIGYRPKMLPARKLIALATAFLAACGLNELGIVSPLTDDAGTSPEAGADAPVVEPDASTDSATDVLTDTSSCGDAATDPSNCGSCGHGCGGGACLAGKCQPLVLLDRTPAIVRAVAVDAANVYIATNFPSNLEVANLDGTNDRVLIAAANAAQIKVDGTYVYYTNGQLRRARIVDGTGDTMVANRLDGCIWLGPGNFAFSTDDLNTKIQRIDLADSGVVTIATAANGAVNPWGVAVTGTDLFWSNNTASGSILRLALGAGGSGTPIRPAQSNPTCITLEGDTMYWPDSSSGRILRSDLSGGSFDTIATGQVTPTQIALSATYLYWNSGTKVMRLAR